MGGRNALPLVEQECRPTVSFGTSAPAGWRYQRWRALLDSYISNPHDGPDIGVIVHEYSHAYRSYTQL